MWERRAELEGLRGGDEGGRNKIAGLKAAAIAGRPPTHEQIPALVERSVLRMRLLRDPERAGWGRCSFVPASAIPLRTSPPS